MQLVLETVVRDLKICQADIVPAQQVLATIQAWQDILLSVHEATKIRILRRQTPDLLLAIMGLLQVSLSARIIRGLLRPLGRYCLLTLFVFNRMSVIRAALESLI